MGNELKRLGGSGSQVTAHLHSIDTANLLEHLNHGKAPMGGIEWDHCARGESRMNH